MTTGSSIKVTDEELSAFLDGELPAETLKRIAAALDGDEALRRRLQRLAFTDRALASAYGAVGATKLPAWVSALIATKTPPPETRSPSPLAIPIVAGAALIFGAALGYLIASPKASSEAVLAGIVAPASALHEALEASPSGADVAIFGGKTVSPVLTFRSGDGPWCREFQVKTSKDAARAIACRRDGGWVVEFAAAAPMTDAAERAEGAAFNGALATLEPGGALSAEEEEAILRAHWPTSIP